MTYAQLLDVCDKQEYYLRQFKERIAELESKIRKAMDLIDDPDADDYDVMITLKEQANEERFA